MKNLRKVFTGAVAGLALLAGAVSANADCTLVGKMQAVQTGQTAAGVPFTFVFFSLTGVLGPQPAWYFALTSNPVTSSQLAAAQAANDTIFINGDAAVCPVSGSFRYIGVITFAFSIKSF